MKKNLKLLLLIVLPIIFVIGSCQIIIYKYCAPDKAKIEKCFQRDKDDLKVVVNYLSNSDYTYIYINKTSIRNGMMFTGASSRYQSIDDTILLQSLERLLNGKYIVIGKNNGTVYFEKWRFLEKDRGLAISLNKETPIYIEFLIKAEELSEHGWYYYEADYEEDRNRRQGTVCVKTFE